MNVVGYIRVSTQGQARDGYSLTYQEIVNKGLAGGKHMNGVDYDVLGFPIFKGDAVKFQTTLDKEMYCI